MPIQTNVVEGVNAALVRMRTAETAGAGAQRALLEANGGHANEANAYHQLKTQADRMVTALKAHKATVATTPNLNLPMNGLVAQAEIVASKAEHVRAEGEAGRPITAALLGELETAMNDLRLSIANYNDWEQAHTAGTGAQQAEAQQRIREAKLDDYDTRLQGAKDHVEAARTKTLKAAGVALSVFVLTSAIGFTIFTPSAQSAFINNPGTIAKASTITAMLIYLVAMIALNGLAIWNAQKEKESLKTALSEVKSVQATRPTA